MVFCKLGMAVTLCRYMTGGAVICLKEKCTQKKGEKSAFWLWGTEAQNGTFSQACDPTKVQFHSLEEQLPQNISYRNKICLFIPAICRLLSLVVCLSLRIFSFLVLTGKKKLPYYFICLSRPLVSLVLSPFAQPWKTISYLQLRGISEADG